MASRNRRDTRAAISADEAAAALALIAGKRGARSLRPEDYEQTRRELADREGAAWLHGGNLERSVPTVDQIHRAFRLHDPVWSWDDGLRAAGLQARAATGGRAGLGWPELIDRFMDEMGFVPSWRQAAAYAAAKNVGVQRNEGRWMDHLAQARARRRERGAPVPRRRVVGSLDLSGVSAAASAEEASRRRKRVWTAEECVAGLVRALELAGGRPLSQKLLRQLAAAHLGVIPTYSIIQREAKREGWPSFPEMRAEAARRRAGTTRSPAQTGGGGG